MPRSAGPKFARVVNVPVELNRRFEFTIAWLVLKYLNSSHESQKASQTFLFF